MDFKRGRVDHYDAHSMTIAYYETDWSVIDEMVQGCGILCYTIIERVWVFLSKMLLLGGGISPHYTCVGSPGAFFCEVVATFVYLSKISPRR